MADKNMPNRAANMEKAEGDRWRSEENAVPASGSDGEDILNRGARGRHATPRRYDEDADQPARPSSDDAPSREDQRGER
jgi:hypothetical protein